jgi:hypothetical protein
MSAVLEEILREIERLRREVDALRCLDQPTLTGHTHTQAESHYSPDTDAAPTSLHHTVGAGANQSAAGNHSHALSALGGNLTQARSHDSADTNGSAAALHHTLGTGAYQASAGNHTHTQAQSHNSVDTDTATTALHHTLGAGAYQAAAGNHTHAGGAVPQYAIIMTNQASCPAGFTEYTPAAGRAIVGVPAGGTVAGTVGTALTNLQDRTHSHSFSAAAGTGPSSNGRNVPDNPQENDTMPFMSHTHSVTVSGTTGTQATSNSMPYIQLRFCQKS